MSSLNSLAAQRGAKRPGSSSSDSVTRPSISSSTDSVTHQKQFGENSIKSEEVDTSTSSSSPYQPYVFDEPSLPAAKSTSSTASSPSVSSASADFSNLFADSSLSVDPFSKSLSSTRSTLSAQAQSGYTKSQAVSTMSEEQRRLRKLNLQARSEFLTDFAGWLTDPFSYYIIFYLAAPCSFDREDCDCFPQHS